MSLQGPWMWVVVVVTCMGRQSGVLSNAQELLVGIDAQHCQLRKTVLYCHYSDGNQVVRLEEVETNDQVVERVTVTGARKLLLGDSCVNISLEEVAEVVVARGTRPLCNTDLELSAKKSTLDRLPDWVSRIHLEESSVISIVTAASITSLTVINCVIKVLDISKPLPAGSVAKFISSSIDTLQRLEIGAGSTLTLEHLTIDVLASKGLILRGGHTEIRSSSATTVMDDSLALGSEATLSIVNFSGELKVGVLIDTETNLCYSKTYFWTMITALTLFAVLCLIALFIIFARRRKRSSNKTRTFIYEATHSS
nr:uncharacterized protein LOC123762317 [Procambarus clarkii]